MLTMLRFRISLLLGLVVSLNTHGEESADEIAKKLANPNTPLASLNFKFQYRSFEGDLPEADDQSSSMVLFQPSFPFPLANGDMILFRPAIPLILDQPDPVGARLKIRDGASVI